MELLEIQGAGYLAELCIAVDDVSGYCDKMKSMDIDMVRCDGQPFSNGKKGYMLEPFGINTAYFPTHISCGVRIEVVPRVQN